MECKFYDFFGNDSTTSTISLKSFKINTPIPGTSRDSVKQTHYTKNDI